MGRYFGIANSTKGHSVSEGRQCWKADPWCNVHSVMHRYGWKPTDQIVSGAYDSSYRFSYDKQNNQMMLNDDEDDSDDDDDDSDDDSYYDSGNTADTTENTVAAHTEDTADTADTADAEDDNEENGDENEHINLGFGASEKEIEETGDHAPIWEAGECKVCRYKLNRENIEKDKQVFNSVYFFN